MLAWIREQPVLKRLRVYVLSASSRMEDIEQCYDLGACSYLVKLSNLNELTVMVQCLLAWLKINHFTPLPEVKADPARSAPAVNGAIQSEFHRQE